MPSARSGEIENPTVGDSVVSRYGMIKVSVAEDGSFPVTKLTKKRGSFNIQLYYEGKKEPDTITVDHYYPNDSLMQTAAAQC